MGMSTNVHGYRKADERWKKFKAIWEACGASNVIVPSEVEEFFGGEDPGDKPGMELDLGDAVQKCGGDSEEGYEVVLSKLPKNTHSIRFINSW